jgi:hypothetical protein
MSRQAEAAQILSDVVRDLSSPDANIKLVLRKCMHAYQIIGLDDGVAWVRQELDGYPTGSALPEYRRVTGNIEWRIAGLSIFSTSSLVTSSLDASELGRLAVLSTTLELHDGIDWIVNASKRGHLEHLGEKTTARTTIGKTSNLVRVKAFPAATFVSTLGRIEHAVLEHASKNYALLAYGEALTDIWQGYRQAVDAKLSDLNFGNHLQTIQNGIRSTNPEDWRLAAYGCRNLIEDVASYLWQDPRPTYELLPGDGDDGKLKVTRDRFLNRISAYLHQQTVTKTTDRFLHDELDRLDASIRSLARNQSAAHSAVSLNDARHLVIATYFILGALVTKTGMIPITSYRDPNLCGNPA